MKDALKWILLAGGAYLAIRATGITLPGFGPSISDWEPNEVKPSDKTSSNEVKPTDKTSSTDGGGTRTSGDSGNGRSTNQTNAAERETIIRRASAGDAASIQKAGGLGIKLNADQWNWYRQQETGAETTVDLFPAGNRAALMDAAEYISRRTGAGLGWLGRRRF